MGKHKVTDDTRSAVKRLLIKRPQAFDDVLEQLFEKMGEVEVQLNEARAQLQCGPSTRGEIVVRSFRICAATPRGTVCVFHRDGRVLKLSATEFEQSLERIFFPLLKQR